MQYDSKRCQEMVGEVGTRKAAQSILTVQHLMKRKYGILT